MRFFTKKQPDAVSAKKPEPSGESVRITEDNAAETQYMALVSERTTRKAAFKMLAISLAINACLIGACLAVYLVPFSRSAETFFITTTDGMPQEMPPLYEAAVADETVKQWAARAVIETYGIDFRNYRTSLGKARDYYDWRAWNQLNDYLQTLADTVRERRMMLQASTPEEPKIVETGMVDGKVWGWLVEMPLVLEDAKSGQKFSWNVKMVIGRANMAEKKSGLEIIQFVAWQK